MADYATNPKARFDHEILDTIEAGLVLSGQEVKSIKGGKASIKGAYVKILHGVPTLIGALIPPYQPGNTPKEYRDQADRTLLLTRSQIASLIGFQESQGLSLVPMRLYLSRGRIKLEIGVARGKKKYDKRESIKKKDVARSRQRGMDDL